MKNLKIAILLGLSISLGFSFSTGHNALMKKWMLDYIKNLPKQSLNKTEVEALIHMREEEKLARDVYLMLYAKWKLPIFKNIAKSEQFHMDNIKVLLDKYGINDPVKSDKVGEFSLSNIKKLYNDLVSKGIQSRVDALKVGATIEDLDIYDLDKAIKKTDNTDIKTVFERLRFGSTNHMRAFTRMLKFYGTDYSPKYITYKEYKNIVNKNNSFKTIKYYKINKF